MSTVTWEKLEGFVFKKTPNKKKERKKKNPKRKFQKTFRENKRKIKKIERDNKGNFSKNLERAKINKA